MAAVPSIPQKKKRHDSPCEPFKKDAVRSESVCVSRQKEISEIRSSAMKRNVQEKKKGEKCHLKGRKRSEFYGRHKEGKGVFSSECADEGVQKYSGRKRRLAHRGREKVAPSIID